MLDDAHLTPSRNKPDARKPENRPNQPLRTLNSADAAALDAAVARRLDHGFQLDPTDPTDPTNDLHSSAGVDRVLSLLDQDLNPPERSADPLPPDLLERTMAKIAAHPQGGSNPQARDAQPVEPRTLAPDDAALVDALLAGRASGVEDLARVPVPAELSERKAGVVACLGLLDRDASPEIPDAQEQAVRSARTLEKIQAARQRAQFAQQIDMLREGPRTAGVSLRQVLSAAAILLLGVVLLVPMLQKNQASQRQAACLSNLAMAGGAFGAYASDHAGVFPRALSRAGASWWNVGQPDAVAADGSVQSNSAHLYLLVRTGYLSADRLACQTNAAAPRAGQMSVSHRDWSTPMAVSYSYQNQFTPEPLRADDARRNLAILADKNPLFVPRGGRLVFDETARPGDPSRQHNGQGQNALSIDGHARWTVAPNFAALSNVLGNDDTPDLFWSLRDKPDDHRYTGHEIPADVANDAFLVP